MFLIDNFLQRVEKTPQKIAVRTTKDSYTFAQVRNLAQKLANKLESNSHNEIIPYYLKNTEFVLPTVLGIWMSGNIPMPLVSALPLNESLKRIDEVDWKTVIVDFPVTLTKETIQINTLDKEADINFNLTKSEPTTAYILSTSGSTGTPKKVYLSEDNIVWTLSHLYSIINVNSQTKFLFSTPYSFDVSLTEILSPVLAGSELVCLPTSPSKSESIRLIPRMIDKNLITHLSLSPSFAEALIDIVGDGVFSKLRYLMVAGENFPIALIDKLQSALKDGCNIFNLYGPTETTIYASYHKVTGHEKEYVPIGKALPGVDLKILDKERNPVKTGEIYIGGRGVTQGYKLDPVQDKKKFITIDNERYYKTGDDVTLADNQEIIFLGRQDDQVQVNGIRVELGEIQTIASKVTGVKSVIAKYENSRIFIFYIGDKRATTKIKQSIPGYLNPIILDVPSFRYTYNRKFDTKKMIEDYYFENINSDNADIQDTLIKILNKYHVNKISELDSLDFVRFIVDIEHSFNINIDDSQANVLTNLERITQFIQDKQNKEIKKDDDTSFTTADLYNLQLLFKNYQISYEEDTIVASSTQQSLFSQGKTSFANIKIALDKIDFAEINRIQHLFTQLSKKIDILTLAWFKKDDKRLYFKQMKDAKPIVFISNGSLSNEALSKSMYLLEGRPIYMLVFNVQKTELEVVFSHHTLDASSITLLTQIIVALLQNKMTIDDVPTSSYIEFMEFTNQINQNTDITHALKVIPKTEAPLNLSRDVNLNIIKFKYSPKDTDDAYITSLYLLAQAIMAERGFETVTGQIAINIRKFKSYDAQNVIGDIHQTIPWEIHRNDTRADFSRRYHKWKKMYETGIDYRYCVFNKVGKNLVDLPKLAARWNSTNISPNYLGEVKSLDSVLNEIAQAPFKNDYITVVSYNGMIYCILHGNLLHEKIHSIFLNENEKIDVINEKGNKTR